MKPGERELTQPVSGNRSIYAIIDQLGEVDKGKSAERFEMSLTTILKKVF
jgi:hypothetical protein